MPLPAWDPGGTQALLLLDKLETKSHLPLRASVVPNAGAGVGRR